MVFECSLFYCNWVIVGAYAGIYYRLLVVFFRKLFSLSREDGCGAINNLVERLSIVCGWLGLKSSKGLCSKGLWGRSILIHFN
jgi:hypothetical protein